jgi:hypothetical protein
MERIQHEELSEQVKQGKWILFRAAIKGIMVLVAIFLLPLCLHAMTQVSNTELSGITGQAGVSINADVTYDIHFDALAWGDADGLGGATTGGYVGITNYDATGWRIKARETDHYGGYSFSTDYKPITIDVATTSVGHPYGDHVTFVRLGLGALELSGQSTHFAMEMGPTNGLGQTLLTFDGGYGEIFVNPVSYVDIFAHPNSGVNLALNIQLDRAYFEYLTWGDPDGLPGGSTGDSVTWIGSGTSSGAGYVGVRDLTVDGPITLSGTVSLDIVTVNSGAYYAMNGNAPVTVVHISLPTDFNVSVNQITARVRLDSQPDLVGANSRELGNIFLSGLNLKLHSGSWVDIWAH